MNLEDDRLLQPLVPAVRAAGDEPAEKQPLVPAEVVELNAAYRFLSRLEDDLGSGLCDEALGRLRQAQTAIWRALESQRRHSTTGGNA